MRPEALAAWTQLYAAVGLLAGICATCALLRTIIELQSGAIGLRKRVLETVGYWCLTDLACAWAALPNARRLASMAMRALISSVLMSSGSNGRPYHSSMDLRFG